MIEIGGKAILWHIMKIYSHFGINDFVICLGYKSGTRAGERLAYDCSRRYSHASSSATAT